MSVENLVNLDNVFTEFCRSEKVVIKKYLINFESSEK